MERIQTIRAGLQRIVESPRAPVLWSVMLIVFTLTFLAQVISASYVFTTVRIGMEGQKTQQEKKINEEVLLIYDPAEFTDIRVLIETRTKTFTDALEKRNVLEESLDDTEGEEVIAPQETTPASSREQKKQR